MLKRPSEHRLTLEERVAVVIAIVVSVGLHAVLLIGGGGIARLAREGQRRERLMVIRRVRESTPAPEIAVRVPDLRRVRVPRQPEVEPGPEGKEGGSPPPPEQKVSSRGSLPPPAKPQITPGMEEELKVSVPPDVTAKSAEGQAGALGDTSLSVVTDLPAATFTLSGPAEYQGTGTFWIRRGAPPGTYRIAFSAVDGFAMPPPQTKDLVEKGQVVFVGKYRRSTEVVVDASHDAARFTIFRPDGRPIDMASPGRALYDDLPPGTYTAVFKDVPGYATPLPMSQTLVPGGRLAFKGEYRQVGGGRGGSGGGSGSGTGSGSGSGGTGSGPGGRRPRAPGDHGSSGAARGPGEKGMDRRVQMVVTSYPRTDIEDGYEPITYPEVVIRKSKFQQGWCQVYLVISVDDSGEVREIEVQRPRPEERAPFEAQIAAVETAVRRWDYDKVSAEVHVDVRFYVE
jgi:hypothetical protein